MTRRPHAAPRRPAPWWLLPVAVAGYLLTAGVVALAVWVSWVLLLSVGR